MKKVVIAGTSSGVGKTTLSIGIMAALKNRGFHVAPFKVGPDYIDPGFHKFVTGAPSYNLDSWMLDEETVSYLFQRNMEDKDIGVVEGVMGLYDGYGGKRDQGSTAHIAKIIKAPTILIIDGQAMSSSAAALVLGYKMYDEELDIKAVIVNKVGGKAHYEIIKDVIERDVKVPCIGYLPSSLNVSLESRHLGLIPAEELISLEEKVDELVGIVEDCIDLDLLLTIADTGGDLECYENPFKLQTNIYHGLSIGIAKDKAFNFYYEDNLKVLRELGANIEYFSPLECKAIPENLDGIYIGGGFPEVFASKLEENREFKQSLKKALDRGLPAYAECGGLMYLTQGIENLEGKSHEMVGFFPTKSKMTEKLQRFGYVEVVTSSNISIKGHEFHRSIVEDKDGLKYKYVVQKRRDEELISTWECGLNRKNVLAGYPHVHFYSNPKFLMYLLDKCKEYQKNKGGLNDGNNFKCSKE